MTPVFPDVLLDLKYYLANHPDLASLTGSRVWFSVPAKPSAAPFLRLYRAGGVVLPGPTPLQDVRIAHEVWGMANKDYDAVRLTVRTVESIYHQLQAPTILNPTGTTRALNAQVTGVADVPDPADGWPRYTLDVVVTATIWL